MATWAAIIPFVKAALALDEARLGTLLLVNGSGSIAASLAAPRLLARVGTRGVLAGAGSGIALVLPALLAAPDAARLGLALLVMGACGGLLGVAANAQALLVQARSSRALMSSFHALFSVGGLAGAGLASVALHLGVGIARWTAVVAAALLALALLSARALLPDDAAAHGAPAERGGRLPTPVLVVGAMTLVLYLAEGAVLDWGGVFLREARGYAPAGAALGYAAFSVAMALGRLVGDRVVEHAGRVRVVGLGAATAAAGFLVLVLVPWAPAGLLGCALIGVGASNVVPTLMVAAARLSPAPTRAVSTAAAMGTCGLLVGPAAVGFAAQRWGLGLALGGLAALLLAVAAGARVVAGRAPGAPGAVTA